MTASNTPGPAPLEATAKDDVVFAATIAESMADPAIVYGPDWTVRYANAAARRTFEATGHPVMVGHRVWTAYPDLAGTAFERELRRAMDERVDTAFIEERRARGRWVEVRCHPLQDGGISVVWKDVTDQKRAERGLEYLLRASTALGSSLDVDVTCNALARLIVPELADWCSIRLLEEEAIRLVAIAHEDPEKLRMVHAFESRLSSSMDSRTRAAHVIRTGETDLVTSITEEMIDQALQDPEYAALVKQLGFSAVLTVPLPVRGRVVGAMSLVLANRHLSRFDEADVALAEELGRRAAGAVENALLYRDAVEARAAAESANSTKSDFLARMSHELRTPLNAIAGYVELMSIGIHGPVTPQQQNDLQRIRRSQGHLLSLINDLLNYARIEAGRLRYDIRPVSLNEALADVEPLFAPQLAGRGLDFAVVQCVPDVRVLADAEKLQQILFNLVSNAIKFTPPPGTITLDAEVQNGVAAIRVTDTGPGIPAEKLESVFDPFVQLPREGALQDGAGLGLTISRDLARGMDGSLSVRSSPAGSVFVVRLPLAPS